MPSDAYEWYAKNGSIDDMRAFCAADTRCAGFYPCLNATAQQPNCAHLPSPADAVLLSGVPSEPLLDVNRDSVVYSKSASRWKGTPATDKAARLFFYWLKRQPLSHSAAPFSCFCRTCDGTAGGASCSFPFVASSAEDIEYYECTVMGSERPWCYSTRPGMWGYCDCAGQNDFGLQWELGEWSDCPVTCGGGLRTRAVTCVNSSSSAPVPSDLCGVPPASAEACSTQASPTPTPTSAPNPNRTPTPTLGPQPQPTNPNPNPKLKPHTPTATPTPTSSGLPAGLCSPHSRAEDVPRRALGSLTVLLGSQ